MIRIFGILVGLGFTFVVGLTFIFGAYTAATEGLGEKGPEYVYHEKPRKVSFQHDGVFGTWDYAQLQRGYQVYKEVCAACHSLDLVAFRNLGELGYTEAEVKAEAASYTNVPGIDPDTGEAVMRSGVPTDYFPSAYPNDVAAAAANNNAIPPDLSLITKARADGTNYLYSLLVGYQEAPAEIMEKYPDFEVGQGLYFNPYFANLTIAMAPPIAADGQVTYSDGTEATISQMSQDVSAFLTWTAEPTLVKRRQTGLPVLGFLLFATILAWFAKKQVWSSVNTGSRKKD